MSLSKSDSKDNLQNPVGQGEQHILETSETTAASTDEETNAQAASFEKAGQHSLLYWEAAFRSQEMSMQEHIVFPRSSADTPLTLRAILDRLFPSSANSYCGTVSLTRLNAGAIENQPLQDVQEVLEHTPFDYIHYDVADVALQKDANVKLAFLYRMNDRDLELDLVIKPLFRSDSSLYIRVSVLRPFEGDEDLKGIFSQTLPAITSMILVHDFADVSEDLSHYEDVEKATISNLKENRGLNTEEEEVMYGMSGMRHFFYNLAYGQWLIEKNRVYDAYEVLSRAYNTAKPQYFNLDDQGKDAFYRICHSLGFCLLRMGFLDKAAYYLQVSTLGGQPYIGLYVETLAQSAHNRVYFFLNQLRSQVEGNPAAAQELKRLETITAASEKNQSVPDQYSFDDVTLGYVLHKWFDLMPFALLEVSVDNRDGNIPVVINDKEKMWMYNISESNDATIYVHYSCNAAENGFAADQSLDSSNNVVILQVQSVKTAAGEAFKRVHVMAPNFSQNDDKKVVGPCNIPKATSFILGATPLALEFSKSQLQEIFQQGVQLKESKRTVEAMRAFEYIHFALKVAYTQADADDATEALFFEATYQLGSCLVELGLYEKALYYLDWAQEGSNVEYMAEYINGLCNSADVRALEEINAVLEHLTAPEDPAFQEAYENYRSFLMRRKSYVLIGRHHFEEAEQLLKEMLNDPLSKEYAEGELRFLQQFKQKG